MFPFSEDKNKLAMLAIPVLLSVFFGFAGIVDENSYSTESQVMEETNQSRVDNSRRAGNTADNSKRNKKYAVQKAIEGNDFTEFMSAAEGTPFSDIMTPEAFDYLVSEYHLYKQGYRRSPIRMDDDLTA